MKLVLFCDYGLDDALATYDALRHAGKDGYAGVDLVAVGGNVPGTVSLRNAGKLLAACDFPLPPVRVVDTTAVAQPEEFLKDIHGEDGMGCLFDDAPSPCPVIPFAAWMDEPVQPFDLVSLGPMTLVPRVLRRGGVRKFVFMGGNLREEPNFHGYEFNHALDRAAFSEAAEYAHVAVTMDTCRHPLLNIQGAPLEGGGIARTIANRARTITFSSGEKGCYIWDDIAVKYLRHPAWFSLEEGVDRDGNRLTIARYTHGKPYGKIIDL